MLIRGDKQTVRLLGEERSGEERQHVVIWQTQTLRSEHSVECGEGGGEHCGLQSETGEKNVH